MGKKKKSMFNVQRLEFHFIRAFLNEGTKNDVKRKRSEDVDRNTSYSVFLSNVPAVKTKLHCPCLL